jgi:hypothetical protein
MKTEINLETMEHEFGAQFDQINYAITDFIASRYNPEAPVKERFISWWYAFGLYSSKHPMDLIFMEQLTSTHLYPFIGLQESTAYYEECKRIIKAGQDEGLIKPTQISLINQFVRCSITALIKLNIASGKTLTEEQLLWVVESCWDGIATK